MSKVTNDLLVMSCIDPDAYAANTYYGDAIDMSKFERAIFVLQVGDLGSSATIDYAICSGATTSPTAAMTAYTATQLTQAGSDDNKQVVIEVPAQAVLAAGHRYIRDRLIVGTATSDAGAIGFGVRARYDTETDLASVDEII